MRVLFLNQYALPAGETGITRHGDIGAELVRRGHDVTVIASEFDYLTRSAKRRTHGRSGTRYDGVNFVWLSTGTYVANDVRRIASMVRYAALATWAGLRLTPAPSVIVGSSPQPLAPLAASIIARGRRVPWVFEARDIWPSALVDLGAIRRNGRAHRLLERVERYCYSRSDAVVSVPPRGCLRLEELGLDARRCVHIPNGATTLQVPPGTLPATLSRIVERRRHGRFLLVYAGAIGVPHRFETVVEAMRLLRDTEGGIYERLDVLVVGDGVAATSTRQSAEALGLENLHFHPAIAKSGVRSLLNAADACLMQAADSGHFRYGLSPNKLFDYFAAGKPVLMASAYQNVVDDAGAGITFMPGDPRELARAIAAIVRAPAAEREAMGSRGRALVTRTYSIAAITDQYEALLRRLVGPTPSPATGSDS